MRKIFPFFIAAILLFSMASLALAADVTVYVTVSVDGELAVAAQPVTVSELTADAVIKAAHAAFFPGGEAGYTAGLDPVWNMFLISQAWGISGTPFVIVNAAPLGAVPGVPATVDAVPVADGYNIIIAVSSNPQEAPAQPVSLTATVSGGNATLTATSWVLDMATFTYSSSPLADAAVIDPETGASLGYTDDAGQITVPIPDSGIIAIDGLAAINPVAFAEAEPAAPIAAAPAEAEEGGLAWFFGDWQLVTSVIGGIILLIPISILAVRNSHIQEKKYFG